MLLMVVSGVWKECWSVRCVCYVFGFVVFEESVFALSMGFVVACLWGGCLECGSGSYLFVGVGVFCGRVFMPWDLLFCQV